MVDYKQVFDIGGHVLVSWDAAQPAVFEQLRRPARWAEYVTRLEQIAGAAAASAAGGKCSLIFTLQKGNIGEVKGIVDLAAVLNISAVQVNIAKTPSTQWITANLEKVTADLAAAGQRAIAAGVTLFVPDQIAGVALPLERQFLTAASHCVAPWREAVIRWNGDVQTCNMFNPFTYGNIHRIPFNEIWQNRFAELFRAKLNEVDRHPYCRACAYIPSAYD